MSARDATVRLSAACDAGCPVCPGTGPARTRDLARVIAGGGARLTIRGGAEEARALVATAEDWREVVLHTHDARPFTPAPSAVLVPLLSHVDAVHDRVVGPGALARALAAMTAWGEAGARVEVEIPLLPRRLAHPLSILRRARAATDALSRARFVVARGELPSSLAPPEWSDGAPMLAEALAFCAEAGIDASIARDDAIPFCALAGHEALLAEAFRFDPARARDPARGCARSGPCDGCACREQCPGVAETYARAHGTRGITPFAARPERLYQQRTTPLRVWTDEARAAAKRTGLLVLRPTVNCNQDCLFCSANETSGNVWETEEAMLAQIARAARRGVERLAFGGGEPTLARALPRWIRAARDLGVEEVELVTNGVLLDREARVAALAEAGLTHAFVSLHAHDERLSRQLTQKDGDFARTVAAIGHLDAAGVKTAVNHVLTSRNYRYVPDFVRFVRERFGGRVAISIAFVTPQYKALEHLELVPAMREVRPFVQAALAEALAIGQPVWVGARQGLPPCQLGPYRAWSDVFEHADAGLAEDAPQKVRGPGCDRCRYTEVCTGVWRPYAERHGTDDLAPIEGPPFTGRERVAFAALKDERWGLPPSDLDALPEGLRDASPPDPLPRSSGELQAFAVRRTRPIRVALFGSAGRARAIARAMREIPALTLDAVVSPHAAPSPELGGCPVWADAAEALEEMRPDAVIVAAAPSAQGELARLALAAGRPVLVSRPLPRGLAPGDGTLVAGYGLLHLEGVAEATAWTLRIGPDAPRVWSRRALAPWLEDVLALAVRADPRTTLDAATFLGAPRPEAIGLRLGERDVALDLGRGAARLTVRADAAVRHVAPEATVAMLEAFAEVAAGRAAPALDATAIARVRALREEALDALAREGVVFERPEAPKHAASRSFRER